MLADAPPLPGEEARYAQILAVLAAIKGNPALKEPMIEAATEVESSIVTPLFQFRNYGQQLPNHWSTISNEAASEPTISRARRPQSPTSRQLAERDQILLSGPGRRRRARLNGANRYTVTFAEGQTPPVNGSGRFTLYNEHHFFARTNQPLFARHQEQDFKTNSDGSLTINIQADPPTAGQRGDWLPAPKSADFSLYVRAYWPKAAVLDGSWTPPAVQRVN